MKPQERKQVELEKTISYNHGRDQGIIAATAAFMFYMHTKQGWGQQKIMGIYEEASKYISTYIGTDVDIIDICNTLAEEIGVVLDPVTGKMTRFPGFHWTPNAKMIKCMNLKRKVLTVGNISDTAKEYGIPRTTLRNYIDSGKAYKGQYYFERM